MKNCGPFLACDVGLCELSATLHCLIEAIPESFLVKTNSMQAGPLLHRIDSAIRKNPFVLHRRVFLESAQGRITLRGKVDSYYQKQMVQEVLRGMDGIAEISNQLEVDDYAS